MRLLRSADGCLLGERGAAAGGDRPVSARPLPHHRPHPVPPDRRRICQCKNAIHYSQLLSESSTLS